METRRDLTARAVRFIFTYDPEEGLLRWREPAGRYGRIPAGTVAGRIHLEGYRYITLDGVQYRASRVIWLYMTGEWPRPGYTVDHKDQNPSNDRWDNLREATDGEQKQNNRLRKDSNTGFKCVVHDKERDQYRWQVVVKGKRIKGKRFATPEEAYADYQARLPEWHGEFANDGSK